MMLLPLNSALPLTSYGFSSGMETQGINIFSTKTSFSFHCKSQCGRQKLHFPHGPSDTDAHFSLSIAGETIALFRDGRWTSLWNY